MNKYHYLINARSAKSTDCVQIYSLLQRSQVQGKWIGHNYGSRCEDRNNNTESEKVRAGRAARHCHWDFATPNQLNTSPVEVIITKFRNVE